MLKPDLLNIRMFRENLMGLEMQKVKLLLTKPSSVGFVGLELSKPHKIRYCPFLFPDFSTDPFRPLFPCLIIQLYHRSLPR